MWVVLFLVSCGSLVVTGYYGNDEIVGKGRWLVLNNMQCENPEQYEIPIDITRKKLNRTCDAFSIHAHLDKDLDITYGFELIAKKEVDGGFKFYQKVTDQSFCEMLKKYTGDNYRQVLAKAKVDPPDCPIPKGEIVVEDHIMDYSELEETGMYGTFDICMYVTYMMQRVGCMRWLMRFERVNENDDDDDDDDDDY
ncbi:hypothetical protein PYW07_006443 [Mythimna separata]|uniref:Uncharacterized protein n=1 Tax=Mythimna separata TaxID=271217 RepID=A0AAD8DWI1_MYTSE|nr:hypothetical protein PYW07_006443 [Mythimna separata]